MDQFIAIPAITILCYLLAEGYKAFAGEAQYKHIPMFCGACGCAMGILCHLLIPGYLPAENGLVAAAIGVVSGIAATGVHQVYKQEADRG